MTEVGSEALSGWVLIVLALIVGSMTVKDICKSIRQIRRLNRLWRRAGRRKQDWSPREHPDVWR